MPSDGRAHTSHLLGPLNYGRGRKKGKKNLLRVIKSSRSNSHRLTESRSQRPSEAKVWSGHGAQANFVIRVRFIRKGEMKRIDAKGVCILIKFAFIISQPTFCTCIWNFSTDTFNTSKDSQTSGGHDCMTFLKWGPMKKTLYQQMSSRVNGLMSTKEILACPH